MWRSPTWYLRMGVVEYLSIDITFPHSLWGVHSLFFLLQHWELGTSCIAALMTMLSFSKILMILADCTAGPQNAIWRPVSYLEESGLTPNKAAPYKPWRVRERETGEGVMGQRVGELAREQLLSPFHSKPRTPVAQHVVPSGRGIKSSRVTLTPGTWSHDATEQKFTRTRQFLESSPEVHPWQAVHPG